MLVTGEAAHDAHGDVIPRNVYINPFGWCWIRPLEYGDILRYQQSPRSFGSLAWLFNTCICGFEVTPEDVKQMSLDIPKRLERGVLEASDISTEETEESTESQDFREDSPFSQQSRDSPESTVEDSMFWLHKQGYTFGEIYSLLLGEIEILSDGFEREQARREDNESNQGDQTSARAIGNRGDRASQLGWR